MTHTIQIRAVKEGLEKNERKMKGTSLEMYMEILVIYITETIL